MRVTLLPLSILIIWALGSCAPLIEDAQCDAAASYVNWELTHGVQDELVFGSADDSHTFDFSWITENERNKALSEFSREPWQNLAGKSPWDPVRFTEVAKTAEEVSLVAQLLMSKLSRNAVARCGSLKDLLQDRGISHGEQAVKAVSAISNRALKRHAKTITDVYVPILSKDGKSAVLLTSRNWAPLAGVGLILKLERQDNGVWRSTRAQQVWIS